MLAHRKLPQSKSYVVLGILHVLSGIQFRALYAKIRKAKYVWFHSSLRPVKRQEANDCKTTNLRGWKSIGDTAGRTEDGP